MFSKTQTLTQLGIALALFVVSSAPLFAQNMLTITKPTGGVVRSGTNIACGMENRYGSSLSGATTDLTNCSHTGTGNLNQLHIRQYCQCYHQCRQEQRYFPKPLDACHRYHRCHQ